MATLLSGTEPIQFRPEELLASIIAKGRMNTPLVSLSDISPDDTRNIDSLVEVQHLSDHDVRWSAAIAIQKIGATAVDALIAVLSHGTPEARGPAIWALEKIGDIRAVEPLIGVLERDENDFCRWMAAAALRSIGDARGIKAVEVAMKDLSSDEIGFIEELREGS